MIKYNKYEFFGWLVEDCHIHVDGLSKLNCGSLFKKVNRLLNREVRLIPLSRVAQALAWVFCYNFYMKEKQQVVHIHGGMPAINHENYINMIGAWSYDPFKISNRWSKRYLDFLNENYEIIRPEMPNKDYANYQAWSIWFEKVIPYLRDNVILIGHSLGGGFLMKWLSINILPVSIKQLHLVAPTNNHNSEDYNLGDFINNEFPGNFSENNIPQIYIYHSEDDPEVPLQESESYHKQLQNSELIRFKNRGHFLDETFPELFANIKRTKG